MSNDIITVVFDILSDRIGKVANMFTPDNKRIYNLYFDRSAAYKNEIRVMLDIDTKQMGYPDVINLLIKHDDAVRVRNYSDKWFTTPRGALSKFYIQRGKELLRAQREHHQRAWFPIEMQSEHIEQAGIELDKWERDQYLKWLNGEHVEVHGQYLNDIIRKHEG